MAHVHVLEAAGMRMGRCRRAVIGRYAALRGRREDLRMAPRVRAMRPPG
ncbi:MAG: hypothetical protein QGI10_01520 [Vicinamibacterales bacterium]|nr:hypothetical protein [Vicinamibacterales bacterium]MDP7477925.1 hypothetical protein [Vicinamibacterales bacterium]MDP7691391.1 hypothetical protein [Vicinamibacterales bacterium]HJN43905.1 hypothetical protein [Vicinamibacterales bacterium]